MQVIRTQQIIIRNSNPYYAMLDDFCFKAKNLYNCAIYHFRQALFGKEERTDHMKLDKQLKVENDGKDYRSVPVAWSAQHVIRQADEAFKAYSKALAAWKKNPEKFSGKPKPPNYLAKETGRQMLQLHIGTVKNGVLQFPKSFKGFTVKLPAYVETIRVVRVVPRNRHIVIEVVYMVDKEQLNLDKTRIAGIDLGLDNLAAIASNTGNAPVLIDGKGLKSINQYWNKRQAHYKSVNDKRNGKWFVTKTGKTKRAERSLREDTLVNRRNNRIKTFMHQASRKIVDTLVAWGCGTLVIGHNKNWKLESNMGNINNQKFVQVPFDLLIYLITYKAEAVGIEVVLTEESYTSKASALDFDDIPAYSPGNQEKYSFSGKRIKRGLYKSSKGLINADVNGALNIIRKVFPDAFASQGIVGYSNPVSVSIR